MTSSATQNPKILIGEGDEILNGALRDRFEENGFEVVQALDGPDCKVACLKDKPDVALINLHMAKADGLEVTRFIKEKSPRTIVIIMTSLKTHKLAPKAIKLGADEHLSKPFAFDDAVKLALRLMENRRIGEDTDKIRKQVREGEKFLAYLTEIINEAIITTDAKGRIQFINRAASRLWGYSIEDLKDKDIHFLIRGEARTLLFRDLVKDTIRETSLGGEFHFRKKDNSTFPGYLSSSVIKANDKVRGIVVVVADLTRIHAIERRLKQSEKMASLGRMVEGVAHEVRNCLTSLGGFTRRLQSMVAQDKTCSQYTSIMLSDVARLERMVKEIEDYVRFSKFYSFQFKRTDLAKVVLKAKERVQERISSELHHAVSLTYKADRDVPMISADPEALEEAFYNLIMNAYEAMPSGGKLRIMVKNLKSSVCVSFADTGVGINPHDLNEVFNPFFTTKTVGAGMGLSKVHLLVEEHGGAINVVSAPGRGSTFEVFLPVDRLMTGLHPWEAISRKGTPHR